MTIPQLSLLDVVLRVLLSMLLGGVIGLERELRDRAAGFRTHILVSVGAATFTLVSAYGFNAFITQGQSTNVTFDPSRIAAQVVSGIGFLGAGAIIRHGVSIRGLTTAASLWAAAAVGIATGVGMYTLAGVAAVAVVLSLYLLRFIEGRLIYPRAQALVDIEILFRQRGFGPLTHLVELLDQRHIAVQQMTVDPDDDRTNTIRLLLQLPRGMSPTAVLRLILELPEVERASLG